MHNIAIATILLVHLRVWARQKKWVENEAKAWFKHLSKVNRMCVKM
jgi:hypothetical protein